MTACQWVIVIGGTINLACTAGVWAASRREVTRWRNLASEYAGEADRLRTEAGTGGTP